MSAKDQTVETQHLFQTAKQKVHGVEDHRRIVRLHETNQWGKPANTAGRVERLRRNSEGPDNKNPVQVSKRTKHGNCVQRNPETRFRLGRRGKQKGTHFAVFYLVGEDKPQQRVVFQKKFGADCSQRGEFPNHAKSNQIHSAGDRPR